MASPETDKLAREVAVAMQDMAMYGGSVSEVERLLREFADRVIDDAVNKGGRL